MILMLLRGVPVQKLDTLEQPSLILIPLCTIIEVIEGQITRCIECLRLDRTKRRHYAMRLRNTT